MPIYGMSQEDRIYHGYDDMVRSFGKIVYKVTLGDWQRDYLYLIQGKEPHQKWGYLKTGYGSCSGCDRYQACDSIKELEHLRNQIFDSVQWFGNSGEALEFFEKHDWEGDYYGSTSEVLDFAKVCQDEINRTRL